ncbi:hypothetical protein TRIATDRAFT_159617 [Trichoderma atroviride IMI 206040]|uniref:Uncharacterized protein n=1 Tax=Hypocrea atroviridis (strain ATCC 20476 / IMI 206040) TaxID=452589 RepID=G9NSW6_HYPAI|nr:uncharacterized protein TRIATDRAFT_159617 [Trichoderma atroviride IMI 206040]EHK46510.1 hypothetical protein TRIATDRAFT_159617 [Trichoderma atroviride IMI 206040]
MIKQLTLNYPKGISDQKRHHSISAQPRPASSIQSTGTCTLNVICAGKEVMQVYRVSSRAALDCLIGLLLIHAKTTGA